MKKLLPMIAIAVIMNGCSGITGTTPGEIVKRDVIQKEGCKIFKVTDENIEAFIRDPARPTILSFHADFCGGCKMQEEYFKNFLQSKCGKVRLGTIDVERNQFPSIFFQSTGMRPAIPTNFLIINGVVVDYSQGPMRPGVMEKWVKENQ